MKPKTLKILVVLGVIAALAIGVGLWVFRLAPTPPIFDESVTLVQASEQAASDGHVVLAVVTADFCPICQSYKRNALVDPRLGAWVEANAETVYLEWERDPDTIEALGVTQWPATLVLDANREVIAMEYGSMSADELMAFLQSARATPPAPSGDDVQTDVDSADADFPMGGD